MHISNRNLIGTQSTYPLPFWLVAKPNTVRKVLSNHYIIHIHQSCHHPIPSRTCTFIVIWIDIEICIPPLSTPNTVIMVTCNGKTLYQTAPPCPTTHPTQRRPCHLCSNQVHHEHNKKRPDELYHYTASSDTSLSPHCNNKYLYHEAATTWTKCSFCPVQYSMAKQWSPRINRTQNLLPPPFQVAHTKLLLIPSIIHTHREREAHTHTQY